MKNCFETIKFRLGLCLRYGKTPPHLPGKCDGCGAAFSMEHAMTCKNGGLIHRRHDTVGKVLATWCRKLKPSASVTMEPRIFPPGSTHPEADRKRGDVSCFGFWEEQTEAIVDVQVIHTECRSHITREPAAILRSAENTKKRKYLGALQAQRKHFTPFVCSSDGLIAGEAGRFLNHLAGDLAAKWEKPYSMVVSQLRTSVSFALVRTAYMCAFNARSSRACGSDAFQDGAAIQPPAAA